MFNTKKAYDCEKSLRRWSMAIDAIGIVFAILCGVIGLIALFIQFALGLIIIVGGIGTGIASIISAHLLWGFADILDYLKRIYKNQIR